MFQSKPGMLTVTGILCLGLTGVAAAGPAPQSAEKPRVIVFTDIDYGPGRGGDDVDDMESVVRLLVYSNEFDIEALCATVNSDTQPLCPELIRECVNAYGRVVGNLKLHASGWPGEQDLLKRIRVGAPGNTLRSVGNGKSTEASKRVIEMVDAEDPRPVWIISWDGLTNLAQALHEVKRDRTPAQVDAFVAKIRVYTITEDTDVEPWIRKTFPKLFYIWADRGDDNTFANIERNGDASLFDRKWIFANVRNDHGPLGAKYPLPSYVPESDSPSFLRLMGFNGLNCPLRPDFGGWGGRPSRTTSPPGWTGA